MPSAEALRAMPPQLVAEVTFYPMAEGGRKLPAQPGWGCPCAVSKAAPLIGYDGWPLLEEPLAAGDRRRVGFVFLSGEEAADVFRKAGIFYRKRPVNPSGVGGPEGPIVEWMRANTSAPQKKWQELIRRR
jgi:hypothetical protein